MKVLAQIEFDTWIEETLHGGEERVYPLALERGQYLHAVVEQDGIDVALEVFAPGEESPSVSSDSPSGTEGPEVVALLANVAGEHRLRVHADGKAPAGRFRLRIDEPRSPSAEDLANVEGEALFKRGEDERRARHRREALGFYEQALERWRAGGEIPRQAQAQQRIGWMRHSLGETDEALVPFGEALKLFQELDDPYWEGSVLRQMAAVHYDRNELQRCLELSREALNAFDALGKPFLASEALNVMGKAYQRRDAFQEALDAYREALGRAREAGNEIEEASALYGTGHVLAKQGKYPEALDALTEAQARYQELGWETFVAKALHRIGTVYYRLDEVDQALFHLERALELRHDPRGKAVTLSSLGTIHLKKTGQLEQAIEHYRRALKLYEEAGYAYGEAGAHMNIGRYHHERGQPGEALASYETALAMHQRLDSRAEESSSRFLIARSHHTLGNFTAAVEQLRQVREQVEDLRNESESADLRTAFFATKQHYFDLYVDVLMHLHAAAPGEGYDVEAFQVHERRSARGLLDLLSLARADLRRGADPALFEQERKIQEELNATDRTLREGSITPALKKRQRDLLRELDHVRTRIATSSPQYVDVTTPRPLSFVEVQDQVLDADTLLLVYVLGEERSFLWCVAHQGKPSVHVLAPRAEIEHVARRTYRAWTQRGSKARKEGLLRSRGLSDVVLRPVAGELGGKRLVVVGDGALQLIPFTALPLPGEEGTPRTLVIENHEVVHLPSATIAASLRRSHPDRERAPHRALVVADPVFSREDSRFARPSGSADAADRPAELTEAMRSFDEPDLERLVASAREAEALREWLPSPQSFVASGFEATRDFVLNAELGHYRIVHLATHGLINETQPELSGLVFSLFDEAGNPRDGFLRLHEIYGLDLRAELVVLSACRTGWGPEIRGEGLHALTRGFLYAGASRLIVSLWNVDDDSTAELMTRFYGEIFKDDASPQSRAPSAALRAAQLSLLQQKEWESPFYWAAFIFQGDWSRGGGPGKRRGGKKDDPGEPPPPSEPPDEHDVDAPIEGEDDAFMPE